MVDTVSWDAVHNHMKTNWRQGQHVCIIGPTGCGKTSLLAKLTPVREYVVMLVTKTFDDTISTQFKDFDRIERWPPKLSQNKVLLWPKPGKTIRDTLKIQKHVFKEALDSIFLERNWTVVFDEQHYITSPKLLGLEYENAALQHQGRSSGLTVVNGTQRPAWVPVITYSSADHAFIWKNTERRDLQRLADFGGIDTNLLQKEVLNLRKHDFIYVNPRKGDIVHSQVRL